MKPRTRACGVRRLVLVLLLVPLPLVSGSDPSVTYVEWEHGFTPVGTTRLAMSPAANVFPFEVGACYRALLLDLLYEPAETGADVPGVGEAFLAHDFRVQLWRGSALLHDRNVTSPSYDIPLGTTAIPGAHEVRLSLANGALVNWSLRVKGWEAFHELACEPRVIVNEVELNPAGPDARKEWVELLNAGDEPADLSRWMLRATHGTPAEWILPEGTSLAPGERLIVTFSSGQALDNEGEIVQLIDALARLRDETPAANDTADDVRTWQRAPDAGELWRFAAGTPNAPNPE